MADKIFRYAEFSEETDYGDQNVQGAGSYEDITGAGLDAPDDHAQVYEGGTGRSGRIVRPGFYAPTGNVEFAPRLETLGKYLYWTLGDGSVTEMWGQEGVLLPTFNTRIGKDLFEHVFYGCAINSFSLNVDDSFAEATLDIVAQRDEKAALQTMTDIALGDASPLAFHEVTITAGPSNADVRSLSMEIANNVDEDSGRGLGSRFPQKMRSGTLDVSLDLEMYFDSTGELENFWGITASDDGPGEADVPNEFTLDLELAAAGAVVGDPLITIELPKCIHTASSLEPSGRDRMTQSLTVNALQDEFGADGKWSPIKVTVGTVAT